MTLPVMNPATSGFKPTYDMAVIKQRMTRARMQLVLNHPFFGTLALSMPTEYTDSLPTAATDGKRVYFNPTFVNNLNDDELLFVVAHEAMHPALDHCFRRGNRDPLIWNIAADAVINYLLTDSNTGKMPQGGVYDRKLYDDNDGLTDKIYDYLMSKKPPPQGGQGQPGDGSGQGMPADGGVGYGEPLDDCMDGAVAGSAEANTLSAEWKTRVVNAATAAKMAGKLSAGMERLVTEVLNPKVPWQDLLRRFVVKAKSDIRSWARPNRRFISQGKYMPSISGEMMGPIAIAVDCSGSIGNKELAEFTAEIRAIKEDMNPSRIDVLYFDSKVSHFETYGPQDDLDIQPHGGGGTAFSPIFRRFNAEPDCDYVCCVVLTDLYCDDFGDPPDYPVMWVSNASDKAPWGEIVLMG
jgi:predicted metal-dependent peptidase